MLHDDHQHIHPPGLLGNEGPQLVQVDAGLVEVRVVGVDVEVPHTDLTEVSGMVLVEVDPESNKLISNSKEILSLPVVMLATSVSATSRMLPVLPNPTVTVRDVSSQLTGLLQSGSHF